MIHFTKLSNELAALIDGLPFGGASWTDIVVMLGEAFPGSFSAVHNKNFSTLEMNSMAVHNMEARFFQSYRDHFAAINPWIAYWSRIPAGVVAASEAVAPSRLFRKTEFYNDWLVPQNSLDAAAGVKIDADMGESVQLLLHYPLKYAEEYDVAAVRLLESIKGNLNRTVEFARAVRFQAERAASSAALVDRGGRPAFVVGNSCRLIHANEPAEQLFRSGTAFCVSGGKIRLCHAQADKTFAEAVAKLCRGEETDVSSVSFETAMGRWHLALAAIGTGATTASFGLMLPPRRMVFARATELSARYSSFLDLQTARRLFGLTPAEHALCVRLLLGDSLAQAAESLGLKKETVRFQIKMVFAKMGVTRQSELILMLAKLT